LLAYLAPFLGGEDDQQARQAVQDEGEKEKHQTEFDQ
jgi:hypothetical protein